MDHIAIGSRCTSCLLNVRSERDADIGLDRDQNLIVVYLHLCVAIAFPPAANIGEQRAHVKSIIAPGTNEIVARVLEGSYKTWLTVETWKRTGERKELSSIACRVRD